MNSRRLAPVFLAIVLLITWLLTSSITPIVLKPSGAKTSKVIGIGVGPIPGIGIGIGHFGVGIGISGFGFGSLGRLFIINITMPYIETPIIALKAPSIHTPKIHAPSLFIQFLETPMIIIPRLYPQAINMTRLPGSSGGGGGGGGGGSGGFGGIGTGTTNTGTEVVRVVDISIPWLIYLLIAIIAILLVFTIVSMRGSLMRLRAIKEEKTTERKIEEKPKVELKIEPQKKEETKQPIEMPSTTFLIGPSIVALRGWGGSKYVDLPISHDLPLIWRVGEPMRYGIKAAGVELEVFPEGEITNDAVVFHEDGCHEIRIKMNNEVVERHNVLAIHDYSNHVIGSFRANIIRHGIEDLDKKTPREICRELMNKGALIGTNCDEWESLRIFEEVRYGHYEIDRATHETFIRGLNKVKDSVIMGCGE